MTSLGDLVSCDCISKKEKKKKEKKEKREHFYLLNCYQNKYNFSTSYTFVGEKVTSLYFM